jgi:hypothetical protein
MRQNDAPQDVEMVPIEATGPRYGEIGATITSNDEKAEPVLPIH